LAGGRLSGPVAHWKGWRTKLVAQTAGQEKAIQELKASIEKRTANAPAPEVDTERIAKAVAKMIPDVDVPAIAAKVAETLKPTELPTTTIAVAATLDKKFEVDSASGRDALVWRFDLNRSLKESAKIVRVGVTITRLPMVTPENPFGLTLVAAGEPAGSQAQVTIATTDTAAFRQLIAALNRGETIGVNLAVLVAD